MIERYHWSLHDLDQTDIESLLPYFFHMAEITTNGGRKTRLVYCDQVDWL